MNPSAAIWAAALAQFFVAYEFLQALLDPLAAGNRDLASGAAAVVMAEFLAVHAGGFAPAVAGGRTAAIRAAVGAALLLVYAIFLTALWSAAPYPRIVFGLALLILVRYARVAFAGGRLRELGIRAGMNLFVYFTLMFGFLFMLPKGFPPFGFDATALAELRASGGFRGIWAGEPQRAVAWCAAYFLALGALELLWLPRGGAPAADTIVLGRDGPRLKASGTAYQVLEREGTNWNAVGGLLIAAMFGTFAGFADSAILSHPRRVEFFGLGVALMATLAALMSLAIGLYHLGRKSGIAVQGGALRIWEEWFGRELSAAHIPVAAIVSILPPPGAEQAPDEECGLHVVTREHGEFDIVDELRQRDAAAFLRLLAWLMDFRWEAPRFQLLLREAPEVRALLGERGVRLVTETLDGAAAPSG